MAGPGAKLRADEKHLWEFAMPLVKIGCEGFMFRNPASIGYEQGRTENLLRWKFTEN